MTVVRAVVQGCRSIGREAAGKMREAAAGQMREAAGQLIVDRGSEAAGHMVVGRDSEVAGRWSAVGRSGSW